MHRATSDLSAHSIHCIARIRHQGQITRVEQSPTDVGQTLLRAQQREELLRSENRLSRHDMFYLPVAPSAYPMVKKNDYIREKYNISKNELIVIHAGSFGTWTYAEELIDSMRHWPDNIVLLIGL